MEINRKPTQPVAIGKLVIGGGAPIVVQSMTKTDTRDVTATIRQIKRLERAGCELVRVAVLDEAGARAITAIRKAIAIPLVADIHFNYRLALLSIQAGADKIRINPGNIGESWKMEEVIKACRDYNLPIRIGINTGSLDKGILVKYGSPTPRAIIESLEKTLSVFVRCGFSEIVISAKASDVATTVQAYQLISERFPYPLHLGLTESGLPLEGTVRSTAALSLLLREGIGDTIRVSLTGDPVLEVKVGYEILKSLGIREFGPTLISCPVCGRCEIDLLKLVKKAEARLKGMKTPVRIAIMGCVVNGPGEAREADYGIAGGRGQGLIFKKGKIIKKVKASQLLEALLGEIEKDTGGKY